jgi:hypothetical protein
MVLQLVRQPMIALLMLFNQQLLLEGWLCWHIVAAVWVRWR